jgi:hypothetical protein
VALLLLVTSIAFTPRYEVNDDVCMNLIVAGRCYTDEPDEHLVFSNVLVGLALRGLYRAAPEVPWYGLYLTAVTALALWGLCYALLRARPDRVQVVLAGGFLLTVGLPCLVWLQFTRTAALAALAGVALLLVATVGRAGAVARSSGLLLLLLSCLVRFESCLLLCAVLAPVLVGALLSPATPRRRRVALAGCLAGVLAGGWALGRFNLWYYERDPGWRGFYEYNALRAQFTDYFRVDLNERTRPSLAAVGWSSVDLAMLYSWSFADRDRFSAEKLRAVLAAVGPSDRLMMFRSWHDLADLLGTDGNLLALLGFGFVCLALMGGGWRARIIPVLCLLAALAVSAVLYFYFHLPARVYFPAYAAFPAAALIRLAPAQSGTALVPRQLPPFAWAATLAAVGVLIAWRLVALRKDNALAQDRDARALRMVQGLGPRRGQLFVAWAANFPIEELVSPLRPLSAVRNLKLVGLGWLTPTPLTERRLREFGITDLYPALYERRDVFLISDEGLNWLLAQYLGRHYHVRLGAKVVFKHPALEPAAVYTLTDLNRLRPPANKGTPSRATFP